MFDDPKPKDDLHTTVENFQNYGIHNFNKGIDACIEYIRGNDDTCQTVAEYRLIEALEQLKIKKGG